MSYTISGSAATSVAAYVTTNEELAEGVPGVEYMDGQENQPVLVFQDPGGQLAYVIEGNLAEMEALLQQAAENVRRYIEGG